MSEIPEAVTAEQREQIAKQAQIAEQAQIAGRIPSPESGPIDALADHIHKFIDGMPGDTRSFHLLTARTKADELIYWLRAHLVTAHSKT